MQERKRGFSLIELTVSLSLLVIVSLAASLTLVSGMKHRRESFQMYRARGAIRDLAAEIQETANLPQDLPNQEGIGAVYTKYNNQTFPIAALPAATITVQCFANEATVPANLGGPQDLNFDGDAQDNLGNQSAGSDMKLIPVTLTATFTEAGTTQQVVTQRLVAMTAD
jgi:prepilin-type N-terminal cleavage/methylation domain-containing protein